jgi:hypothetical protein
MHMSRGVVPVAAGCAMAHPDFGRSVKPISTRGDRLCPPNYYWHSRIFRPSFGPGPIASVAQYRAEILTIFGSYFGRNDYFINSS